MDIRPLAMFLKEQAIKTIDNLIAISTSPPPSADTLFEYEHANTQISIPGSWNAPYVTGPIAFSE